MWAGFDRSWFMEKEMSSCIIPDIAKYFKCMYTFFFPVMYVYILSRSYFWWFLVSSLNIAVKQCAERNYCLSHFLISIIPFLVLEYHRFLLNLLALDRLHFWKLRFYGSSQMSLFEVLHFLLVPSHFYPKITSSILGVPSSFFDCLTFIALNS